MTEVQRMSGAPAPSLSALTFNIKVGVDSHTSALARDLLAIERRLGRLQLISLQEVGRCWQMGVPIHQAEHLAAALGHQPARFAPALTDSLGGHFGVAASAEVPLEAAQQWLLPRNRDEQRTLASYRLSPKGWAQPITAMITHLSIYQEEREAQARFIAAQVEASEGPLILLGDLNDLPDSETLKTLGAAGLTDHWPALHQSRGYSFSVKEPNRRIDYLLTRGLRCVELELLTWVKSSDHFPLWGRFELEEA